MWLKLRILTTMGATSRIHAELSFPWPIYEIPTPQKLSTYANHLICLLSIITRNQWLSYPLLTIKRKSVIRLLITSVIPIIRNHLSSSIIQSLLSHGTLLITSVIQY